MKEIEGDVLCAVDALKRTRCLGFVHLLPHEDMENLADMICWPVTRGGHFQVFCPTGGDERRRRNALGNIWALCQKKSECELDKR